MNPCEHSAFVHYGPVVLCYWCGTVVRGMDPEGVSFFSAPDVERMIAPTPRDEVDAFILTLKGVAR